MPAGRQAEKVGVIMGKHVGFVGLGRMGGPMVSRLLAAGHDVTAFDINEPSLAKAVAGGVRPARSAREVAEAVETVLVSLPTPDIVREVVLGDSGIVGGHRVRRLVDLSTSGPRAAAAIAAELSARGPVIMLDAPVSGGVAGAVKGTLAV